MSTSISSDVGDLTTYFLIPIIELKFLIFLVLEVIIVSTKYYYIEVHVGDLYTNFSMIILAWI